MVREGKGKGVRSLISYIFGWKFLGKEDNMRPFPFYSAEALNIH